MQLFSQRIKQIILENFSLQFLPPNISGMPTCISVSGSNEIGSKTKERELLKIENDVIMMSFLK